jgi:hypothetical protein
MSLHAKSGCQFCQNPWCGAFLQRFRDTLGNSWYICDVRIDGRRLCEGMVPCDYGLSVRWQVYEENPSHEIWHEQE